VAISTLAQGISRTARQAARRSSSPASVIYCLVNLALALAGLVLTQSFKEAWVRDLGLAFVGTGLSGLVVFVNVLLQQESAASLRVLTAFGLKFAYDQRGVGIRDAYIQRSRLATKGIDILGFGLNGLREDRLQDLAAWATQCQVRILLLDPDAGTGQGSFADARDLEEGAAHPGGIRTNVEAFLADTASLRSNKSLKFDVRLYKCMPTVSIYRIDRELFFGPYLVRKPSRNQPSLLVGEGAIFDALCAHFEAIWNDDKLSRRVTDEGPCDR